MARWGDGPIDKHCLPSTVATDLGELVDRYRRKALESYLGSSARCRERDVRITEPTLQRGNAKALNWMSWWLVPSPRAGLMVGVLPMGRVCGAWGAAAGSEQQDHQHIKGFCLVKPRLQLARGVCGDGAGARSGSAGPGTAVAELRLQHVSRNGLLVAGRAVTVPSALLQGCCTRETGPSGTEET